MLLIAFSHYRHDPSWQPAGPPAQAFGNFFLPWYHILLVADSSSCSCRKTNAPVNICLEGKGWRWALVLADAWWMPCDSI